MEKMPVSTFWQKRFSDYLTAHLSLKKTKVQKIFFLLQLNCSRAKCKYRVQELKKAQPELCLPEKFGGERSFGLAYCLDGAAGTRREELTGGGDAGIGDGVTVRAGAGLIMS